MSSNNYVPTLAIRPSEMRALESLPKEIKNQITPCILLAPWVHTTSLKRAIERIEGAFPNRAYFLDIDRDYHYPNPENPAQQELRCLSDPANWKKWFEFIRENRYAHPCIQFENKSKPEIRQQIEVTQELGRRYCIRIERVRPAINLDEIVSTFEEEGSDTNLTIILEGGWTVDALRLFAWFEGLMAKRLRGVHNNVPIVISCTSIPKMFSDFSGINRVPFNNRRLVRKIQEGHEHAAIIYGDWGSTRPRENTDGGMRPIDRIDYPTDDAWYIVRNPSEDWDFKRAAEELVDSEIWDSNLDAWGAEMIRQTNVKEKISLDGRIGIGSHQQNTAARVNIHLHRQAFYGREDISTEPLDDDWED